MIEEHDLCCMRHSANKCRVHPKRVNFMALNLKKRYLNGKGNQSRKSSRYEISESPLKEPYQWFGFQEYICDNEVN